MKVTTRIQCASTDSSANAQATLHFPIGEPVFDLPPGFTADCPSLRIENNRWMGTSSCPSITAQPVAATVCNGSTAGFSVSATGSAPLAYQWRKNGVNLVDGATGTGSTISGATSATLTIDNASDADAGAYDVVVSNSIQESSCHTAMAGSATSAAAALEVLGTFAWSSGLPVLNGNIYATTVWDDGSGPALYAGGQFTIAGGVPANNIAKWNGSSWSALGSGVGNDVYTLTVYDGALIAGGLFVSAGGNSANYMAKWNGSAWSPLEPVGMGNRVIGLTVYNGMLIAGGDFATAGGVNTTQIAQWDGSNWSALGSGVNGAVRGLTTWDPDGVGPQPALLIAGGGFTTAGGNSAIRVAQWNGTSWSALEPIGMDSTVYTLTVYNGALIAGGFFTTAGGNNSASFIAQWNGSIWSALENGMSDGVRALTVFNGDLIAGGAFTTAGGSIAKFIAQWDGSNWSALNSGMDDEVYALTVFECELIAGGVFAQAGGNVSDHFARWRFGTTCPRGDINCDQVVTSSDVPLFAAILLDPDSYNACERFSADLNADCSVDGLDIGPFTTCVLGSGCP